jgi:hypothetical protein
MNARSPLEPPIPSPNDRYTARLEVLRLRILTDHSALDDLGRLLSVAEKQFGPTSIEVLETEFVILSHRSKTRTASLSAVDFTRLVDRCAAIPQASQLEARVRMLHARYSRQAGDPDGIALYKAELARREEDYGRKAQITRRARLNLAVALRDSGCDSDRHEAAQLIEEELAARRIEYGDDNPFTLVAMIAKAKLLLTSAEANHLDGDAQLALDIAVGVVNCRETLLGHTHQSTLNARQVVGRALLALGRFGDAVWWLYGLDADQAADNVDEVGETSELLARALAQTGSPGDRAKAAGVAEEAVRIYLKKYGFDGAKTVRARELAKSLA